MSYIHTSTLKFPKVAKLLSNMREGALLNYANRKWPTSDFFLNMLNTMEDLLKNVKKNYQKIKLIKV